MVINIVGKGSGWELAPSVGNEYDTWGITQLLLRRPVDLVIDMNVYDDMRWGLHEKKENDEVRKQCASDKIPYIGLKEYPLDEIVDKFETDYFGSTADYAIALAIHKGYDEINLYGVNMFGGDEYAYQKPSVDFWCGYAKGKGIKLSVFGKLCNIMRTRNNIIYGYDTKQRI